MGQAEVDKRDSQAWVALELTKHGEGKIEEGTLAASIRKCLDVGDDFPVFIPATTYTRGNKRITVHLMEGYAFVGTGLEDFQYFALERQPFIHQVMSTRSGSHRMRALYVVPPSHVATLQGQLRQMVVSDVATGTRVLVVDGTYRGLDGVVEGVEGEFAFVDITLRSLKVIATIPQIFLEVEEEGSGE